MTEAEWLACKDPQPMLEFLRGKASDRKWTLFTVACCRRIWHLLSAPASREHVDRAERQADGSNDAEVVSQRSAWDQVERGSAEQAAESAAGACIHWKTGPVDIAPADDDYYRARIEALDRGILIPATPDDDPRWSNVERVAKSAATASARAAHGVNLFRYGRAFRDERAMQALLLRDIFGNPFRPSPSTPSWLTPTVKQLAAAIYEERAFERMPILADALEDDGCTQQDILSHCRSGGEHVRGCWVVDLLLGKE